MSKDVVGDVLEDVKAKILAERDAEWREGLRGAFPKDVWHLIGPKGPEEAHVLCKQFEDFDSEIFNTQERRHQAATFRMRRFLEQRVETMKQVALDLRVKAFHATDCRSRVRAVKPLECDCGLKELQDTVSALASTEALAAFLKAGDR